MKFFVFVRAVVLLSIAVMFLAFMSFMLVKLLSAVSVEAQEPGCDTVAFLQMGGNFQFLGDPLVPYVGINAITEDHAVHHAYIKFEWKTGWTPEVVTGVPHTPASDCQDYFDSLVMESASILSGTLVGYPIYADYDLISLLAAVRDFQSSGIHRMYMPTIQGD